MVNPLARVVMRNRSSKAKTGNRDFYKMNSKNNVNIKELDEVVNEIKGIRKTSVTKDTRMKSYINTEKKNRFNTGKLDHVEKVSNLTKRDEKLISNLINEEKPKKEDILKEDRVRGTTIMSLDDAVGQIIGKP